MGGIIDKITEFIKEMLQGWVLSNLETMFTDVNDKVGTIAGEVSTTPSAWNSGIFNMIKTLSENVIVPIAGMIISFVLIYELITMVIDKNNMHDFDTSLFFRFLFKACIAVMLLSKTFDIVMAVFDVGSHVVTQAASSISGSTSLDEMCIRDSLHTFKDHPFRVEDDEKMEETTESIRQYGVLVPGIARPREGGGYEIIAGHRRKRGSELAGKKEMPVIVRNYTDDEATIIMVDSNIQREDILPKMCIRDSLKTCCLAVT